MGLRQKFGIKYPFSMDNNEELYVDLNTSDEEAVKSKVLHVLFTPKGQRLRAPEFGTELPKFLFSPSDDITFSKLKASLRADIQRYVPEVEFQDITIADDETRENSRIIIVHYIINTTDGQKSTSVGVKI